MNKPWSKFSSIVGWVLTALSSVALAMSAAMKIQEKDFLVKEFTEHLGFPANTIFPIGIIELLCVALYLIPRTSLFGVAMITAYLGGACAAHVRIGEPCIPQVILATIAWAGLALRYPALLRTTLLGQRDDQTAKE
jgi:hypothetical protein